jgi:hypothetical protein
MSLLAACGGGEPEVTLTIDGQASRSTQLASVILSGASFVPFGSTCPNTGAFAEIGTLAAHTLTWTNKATGASGPATANVWTCNTQDGRVMRWTSSIIGLQTGANEISVTMVAGSRSSAATVTVTRE